jgi:molybdopterin synthase sulfur carrier subunit
MKVTVRYFASLREALGPRDEIEVEPGLTVGALRDQLILRDGTHASALARSRAVRAALDQRMCDEDVPLHDGAEVAFFPPVTGG